LVNKGLKLKLDNLIDDSRVSYAKLIRAAQENNTATVRSLENSGVLLNCSLLNHKNQKLSLLDYAAINKATDVTVYLLGKGQDQTNIGYNGLNNWDLDSLCRIKDKVNLLKVILGLEVITQLADQLAIKENG
jgi:hypothetical protein